MRGGDFGYLLAPADRDRNFPGWLLRTRKQTLSTASGDVRNVPQAVISRHLGAAWISLKADTP
jgi:hypothetical protein